MKALVANPVVQLALRVVLGAVFLLAAWSKIVDIPTFAAIINNYKMLPAGVIPHFATILAGGEVVVGLTLVAGVWRKGSAVAVNAMLVMFLVALIYAYAAGRSIHCGCFTADLDPSKAADIRGEMLLRIVQDIALLIAGIIVAWGAFSDPDAIQRAAE